MARLGEQLIAARLLTPEQVDQALRAQVLWGGRLGTNLIELGAIDLEGLSRALGRQHGLPAALGRHFDKSDPEIQDRIPAALADRWLVVPLLRIADGKIAVASADPLDDDARAELAEALEIATEELVVSVAAELRVRYHLERVFGITRDARFLRSKGPSVTPFPRFADVEVTLESEPEIEIPIVIETEDPATPVVPVAAPVATEAADDLAVMIDLAIDTATVAPKAAEPTGRDRRTYVRTLADVGEDQRALGRIAIRRVALTPHAEGVARDDAPAAPATLVAATRAIRRGPNRDRVADLVIDTLDRFAPMCEAAMLLVIRGDVATGWKWFCRSGTTPPELAVPLDQHGLVPSVVERKATARCGAGDLSPIDQLLLESLGRPGGDLVVVPITIGGQVMCLVATATEAGAAVAEVEAVASAAAAAFTRLIRAASR